jgi:hypothetical protein
MERLLVRARAVPLEYFVTKNVPSTGFHCWRQVFTAAAACWAGGARVTVRRRKNFVLPP